MRESGGEMRPIGKPGEPTAAGADFAACSPSRIWYKQ